MKGDKVLDVREIDKRFRKKIILNLFDSLHDGNTLALISNHSLSPLQKLFHKEKHGFFDWKEEESGPEIWRISIRKQASLNLAVNEIIRQFPFAIAVFEQYDIPYFNFGLRKLSDISSDALEIYNEIAKTPAYVVNPLRTDNWSVDFTIDYIVQNHHTYVSDAVPEIETLIDHLVEAHAATHPQLPMIKTLFTQFKDELTDHIRDEEKIVFPSFKKLSKRTNDEGLSDAINWMKEDHVLTGSSLRSVRKYCNNYQPPKDSSPGFKILYEELRKFEYDMHFHMYLENDVLFSKVKHIITPAEK